MSRMKEDREVSAPVTTANNGSMRRHAQSADQHSHRLWCMCHSLEAVKQRPKEVSLHPCAVLHGPRQCVHVSAQIEVAPVVVLVRDSVLGDVYVRVGQRRVELHDGSVEPLRVDGRVGGVAHERQRAVRQHDLDRVVGEETLEAVANERVAVVVEADEVKAIHRLTVRVVRVRVTDGLPVVVARG